MALKGDGELVGQGVLGFRDDRIGRIDELYFEGDSAQACWARVRLGLLGRGSVLVPLHDAELADGTQRRRKRARELGVTKER
jgi:hypothetical protein